MNEELKEKGVLVSSAETKTAISSLKIFIHIPHFGDYGSQEPARNELLQQFKLFVLEPESDFIKILIHPTYVFLNGFNCLLDTTELGTIFFQRAEESFHLVRENWIFKFLLYYVTQI